VDASHELEDVEDVEDDEIPESPLTPLVSREVRSERVRERKARFNVAYAGRGAELMSAAATERRPGPPHGLRVAVPEDDREGNDSALTAQSPLISLAEAARRRPGSTVGLRADEEEGSRSVRRGRTLSRGLSSLGSRRLGDALRRAVSSVSPASRQYSHASLNEHMLGHSLTRSIANRQWWAVAKIVLGWSLSMLGFFGLLFVFALYACELFSSESTSNADWRALLLSWGFSVCQRFIVNEPMLILLSKGVPMLFTSELCANVCGETVVNLLDLLVQAIATCIKSIKAGG